MSDHDDILSNTNNMSTYIYEHMRTFQVFVEEVTTDFIGSGRTLFDLIQHRVNGLKHYKEDFVSAFNAHTLAVVALVLLVTLVLLRRARRWIDLRSKSSQESSEKSLIDQAFYLAKTANSPGHIKTIRQLVKSGKVDVNKQHEGLTLFLSACLSGNSQLIQFLLRHGGDITIHSYQGDSALYLATFAVLSSRNSSYQVLQDLLDAGCDINHQNDSGFTCLHRAASKGDLQLVTWLLERGASIHISNNMRVYPIDSAINAGHIEVAELLQIPVDDNHTVWDVVEPHTPPRIQLGLQSPRRRHLVESSRPANFHHIGAMSDGNRKSVQIF